tara:strand:- start:6108 stop:6671 length:564 start_codon:yes stop_codon:yes gene_type:complete
VTTIHLHARPAPQDADSARRIAARSKAARVERDASARSAGCDTVDFAQAADGRPLPTGRWHWSISHGRDWVAGAVHVTPIGIDVERIHLRPKLLERVLDAKESELLSGHEPDHAFIRAWTGKEAVVKASGVGLQDLSHCKIVAVDGPERLWLECHGERLRVDQRTHAGHVLAVHAPGLDWNVAWHLH